jgi:hypothetical protein
MPTIVTICGTDRSGSTMLDLILGNSQDAFSCGEVSAWFRPYRKHHLNLVCPCNQNPCPIWSRIKNVPERKFHATVVNELGVNFVIDSSKDICWVTDIQKWAIISKLKVQNIVIWKSPIELAYSYWKRGQSITYWRKQFLGYYQKIIQIGIPFWAINYDEFVNDPSRKIQETCQVIGMPYFNEKERFWEKEHHHLFGSTGVQRQLERGISSIKPRKTYPDGFKAQIDFLEKQLESDKEIGSILEILRRNDVHSFRQECNESCPVSPRKVYPLWYYRKQIQRKFRRYFMEPYNASANEEVDTIPAK